jgi:hypothetical protein
MSPHIFRADILYAYINIFCTYNTTPEYDNSDMGIRGILDHLSFTTEVTLQYKNITCRACDVKGRTTKKIYYGA